MKKENKKNKLPRVNIIRQNVDVTAITAEWKPILERAGVPSVLYKPMSLYCNQHELLETQIGKYQNSPLDTGNDTFTKFILPPTITMSTLPLVLSILSGIEKLRDMRIEIVNAPMYMVLIDDMQYVDEIGSVEGTFNIPASSAIDAGTNIIDIYKDRMVDHFRESIIDYINSVPNADTLVIYNFGELFMINDMDGQMNSKNRMKMRFRIKAFEDATYIPSRNKEKDEKVIIDDIGPMIVDEKVDQPIDTWIVRLDKEPSKFKKWVVMVLLGVSFAKMKSNIFYKDYWM